MIYFHVGLPKSGSSAIQVYLNENAEVLKNYNVCYPWPHAYNQMFRTSGGNARPLLQCFNQGLPPDTVADLRSELGRLCSKFEKIIVSSEAISVRIPPADLAKFVPKGVNAKVVIYFRNQVDKFVSDVNQTIKNGFRDNYGISEGWFQFNDYYEQVKKWSEVFGRENLILKSYIRSNLKSQDVVEDFCELVGVPFLGYDKSEPINPSLGHGYLEIMRIINAESNFLGDKSLKKKLKDFLWVSSVEKGNHGGDIVPFPVSILEEISKRLATSNEKLSAEFGVEHLDLSHAVTRYKYSPPDISPDALGDVFRRVASAL